MSNFDSRFCQFILRNWSNFELDLFDSYGDDDDNDDDFDDFMIRIWPF